MIILIKQDGSVYSGSMPAEDSPKHKTAKTAEELIDNPVLVSNPDEIKEKLGFYELLPGGCIYSLNE